MRARSQQIYHGELLIKIDQIIKKFRLNISSPVAILRAILVEAYPVEYHQSQGISIFASRSDANEREVIRKLMWHCFKRNKSKSDLLADVLHFINENISTILTCNKLKLLFAAYFSIFQRYRRYLNDQAASALFCVDFWVVSFKDYFANLIAELDNPVMLSENINQLRQVMHSHFMRQVGSVRLLDALDELVVVSEVYRGEALDEFICEIKELFTPAQRANIARNLWNRCGLQSYDSTEKSLKALLVFYDDIDIQLLHNQMQNRLNHYIYSDEYPDSLKVEAIKFAFALLKSLSGLPFVTNANRYLSLMMHPQAAVRTQAMHSFVECKLYITNNLLGEIIRVLFENLRSNVFSSYTGVIDIIAELYGHGNGLLQENIVNEMCQLLSDGRVNEIVRLDIFRFFHLIFESMEHKRKIHIIQLSMGVLEASDYSNTRIPAAFLNQYHTFMKENYLYCKVNLDWDGEAFSTESIFLQKIMTMSELARFVNDERRKLFCDAVFKHLLTTIDVKAIGILEQAFVNLLPMLDRAQFVDYMRRLIATACDISGSKGLDTGVQSAYQSRYLAFFIQCHKAYSISIDADLLCDHLIKVIQNSADNVECILDGIQSVSLLRHNQESKIKLMSLFFELIKHHAADVREAAMARLNSDFYMSLPFFSSAINEYIKGVDQVIDKHHLNKITYLSEILISLKNVISKENFNNIVHLLLNKMDNSEEWHNLAHNDRDKVYTAFEVNLEKMDHHMLIMLLSRLRRIIADKTSIQQARGLYFKAYEALQQNLTADLLAGYANQVNVAAPDEVIGFVLSFSRH